MQTNLRVGDQRRIMINYKQHPMYSKCRIVGVVAALVKFSNVTKFMVGITESLMDYEVFFFFDQILLKYSKHLPHNVSFWFFPNCYKNHIKNESFRLHTFLRHYENVTAAWTQFHKIIPKWFLQWTTRDISDM